MLARDKNQLLFQKEMPSNSDLLDEAGKQNYEKLLNMMDCQTLDCVNEAAKQFEVSYKC